MNSNLSQSLPALPDGMLRRDTLIKKINKASASKKHLYISAPGGFGKTVTLLQWAHAPRRETAWIRVFNEDNEASHFFKRLALALCAFVGKEKLFISSERMEFAFDAGGVLRLIEQFPKKHTRCALILDDMHLLKDKEALRGLSLILERAPEYIFFAMAGRNAIPDEFANQARFLSLGENNFMFSLEEAKNLCLEQDVSFSAEMLDDLYQLTGGWPMALNAYITKSMYVEKDIEPTKAMQYFFNRQFWQNWSKEIKNDLMLCSLPDEISIELCSRLTGRDDANAFLNTMIETSGAFLTKVTHEKYRFHDLLRDWLRGHAKNELDTEKMRCARAVLAQWHFDQGNFFVAASYYIENNDDEEVNRCMRETNRFSKSSGNLSVESKFNFVKHSLANMPEAYRIDNPYLLCKCAVTAFHDGEAALFTRYGDFLGKKMPEIAQRYSDILETVVFVGSLDFRIPLSAYAKKMSDMFKNMPAKPQNKQEARSGTITQNLPFVHRSMRDFSEYHALDEKDLQALYLPFKAMIGRDYDILHHSFIAGIHYEKNQLPDAVYCAMHSVHLCDDRMQAETFFAAQMILITILDAMGDRVDATRILSSCSEYVEHHAQFLYPNLLAVRTARELRNGDTSYAKDWLTIYAAHPEHLPFYQICRHFTTLRAHIALSNWDQAIAFAQALLTLSMSYKRPIDAIEAGILLSIAYWAAKKEQEALLALEKALRLAQPYGFTRRFIDEGTEILPVLWQVESSYKKKKDPLITFIEKIISEIYEDKNFEQEKEQNAIVLSEQQQTLLNFLGKGMSYTEMADALSIKHGTVKTHINALYKKLDVHSADEAIAKAKMLKLLS